MPRKKDKAEEQMEAIERAARTYSRPSDLKITDMRVAVVRSNYDYPIIRLDTNQGVYGIGEVRDAGHKEDALRYKALLLGQNPLNVDMIFRRIKTFGTHGREGGGVSGIELALWDLVGKVYGVPCYQFLGGKYRDRVRLYADTPDANTPEEYVKRVLGRKALGFTFIKFDITSRVLTPDVLIGKPSAYEYMRGRGGAPGSQFGARVTDEGIRRMAEIAMAVRQAVGWDTSLCIDHFGHGFMTAKEVIKLGRALEPVGLGWMEDPMPWWDVEGHRQVTQSITTPTAAGEELYLWDGFREFIEKRAVDIIHPDLLTSGGMLETKKIADYAERYGIPTALHFAGSPIAFMANVHCAAAISSFVALENHAVDLPFWKHLVTGMDDPWMENGFTKVPEKPGLGVDLNLEVIKENLRPPSKGFDEPTDYWNTPKVGFWRPVPEESWD